MILYHGSYLAVMQPDISFSRDNVDFGRGFYTMPFKEQAISWSDRFRRSMGKGVVSLYELDINALRENAKILEFNTYSDEWLDFIVSCRSGVNVGEIDKHLHFLSYEELS